MCSPTMEGIPWGLGTQPRSLSCLHPPKSPEARWASPPPPLLPTCLLGLAPGGGAPRPVPRGVEGCHADHVGSVASQVLDLDAVLGQEKCLHPLGEVPPLGLPEINLRAQGSAGVRERVTPFPSCPPPPISDTPSFIPITHLDRCESPRKQKYLGAVSEALPEPSFPQLVL